MRYGCCVNMIAQDKYSIGYGRIPMLAKLGYDYVELPIAQIMDLNEDEFKQILELINQSNIPCEACNNFFPPSMRLTGDNHIPMDDIEKYVKKAKLRVEKLGAKRIVFGSSGAKNVPNGFDYSKAWQQIVDVVVLINGVFADTDIIVTIEPLNKIEGNIVINSLEGYQLVNEVKGSNVRLLLDYYHMALEDEQMDNIDKVGHMVEHAHISNPPDRVFLKSTDKADYSKFIKKLLSSGYNKRISVEAFSNNFENDAAQTIEVLRKMA